MVALVAFAALQASDELPFPTTSPASVAQALQTMGYRVAPTVSTGTNVKLTHKGVSVDLSMAAEPPVRRGEPFGAVRRLQLWVELAFPREIPLDLEATNARNQGPTQPILFIPHLGKTVSVDGFIDLPEGVKIRTVREGIERFWKEADEYARSHGGNFAPAATVDWRKVRFPDSYVLRVADQESLSRLVASWDWWPRRGGGGSTAGWIVPVDIRGNDFTIWQGSDINEAPGQTFSFFGTVDEPPAFDVERWFQTYGKRFPWAVYSDREYHQVMPKMVFDLRKGMSLGEIHRRMKAFAADVDALQRTIGPRKSRTTPNPPQPL